MPVDETASPDRLLIIDDDTELCEMIQEYLGREGFAVEVVYESIQGLNRALSRGHELVILDVMLPGLDGFEILRRIRRISDVPVLMLTARAEEIDRVVGLEIGADDYLPKPFSSRELLARIRAILRRSRGMADPDRSKTISTIVVGDIVLDPGSRSVRCGGTLVTLTSVEFQLAEVLLRHAGHVVKREDLSSMVLGRMLQPYDRSIDTHVSALRKKLGRTEDKQDRIKAVRGCGYVYVRPGPSPSSDGDTVGG